MKDRVDILLGEVQDQLRVISNSLQNQITVLDYELKKLNQKVLLLESQK